MIDSISEDESAPTRSVRVAYFWWLTLLFGAHRFYVGKWLTALVYPVLVLLFIAFLAWFTPDQMLYFGLFYFALLLVDAYIIPRLVRQRNEWFAEDLRVHPDRYLIPDSDDIAPWARGHLKKEGSTFGNATRAYFFFWFVPLLTGVVAAQLHSLELLIIPIVVLGAIGLIGTLDQILEHHPTVLEIPGVGPAIERVAAMRAHFWEYEPKISSAIWGLFRHWRKFRPYWTLALIVAATVIIESVISYNDNFDHIETTDAAWIIGFTAVLAGAVVLANLVPITALSFHYSLSGKRTRLRFMTVGAFVATIMGYTLSSIEEDHQRGAGTSPSYLSAIRLEKRLEDQGFREELMVKMDVFLWYYINENIDPKVMNDDLRNLLAGTAPNDETKAFEIIENDEWAAMVYYHDTAKCNLKEPDEGVDPSLQQKYSLLAAVIKNTEDVKLAKLVEFQDGTNYEDIDIIELIDYVSTKQIFYRWNETLDHYVSKPECRSLLCGGAFGKCPNRKEEVPSWWQYLP